MYKKIRFEDIMKIDPDNDYIKIYHHFGQDVQCQKMRDKTKYLIKAIESGDREFVLEEMSSILTVIQQIIEKYELTCIEIQKCMSEMHEIELKKIECDELEDKVRDDICNACRYLPICTWQETCDGICEGCGGFGSICNPKINLCAKKKRLNSDVEGIYEKAKSV